MTEQSVEKKSGFNGIRYTPPIKALIGESYSVLGTKACGRRVAVPAVVPDEVTKLKCKVDVGKRMLVYWWETP
jgi:hypothetical protein